MKKLILSALCLSLALSVSACADKPEKAEDDLVYGKATLSYRDFYSGDVTSTDDYDVVTSATTSKYEIMANMATDFESAEANPDGYHITGVKNVGLALPESMVEDYQAINPSFVLSEEPLSQYKTVTLENGTASYSATVFNVADRVIDATAQLLTGTNWGDYQINVTDGTTVHLRNTREDEGFDIGGEIQGIILETDSGLKVGMEHLQSIWVQPYEVSFNVPEDGSHNSHIAAYDNLPQLAALVSENVTEITYIMPDAAYVYSFDGIYIKPIYQSPVTAETSEGYDSVTLSTNTFGDFENGKLTVTYTLGSGRNRQVTTLAESALVEGQATYPLDLSAIASLDKGGVYSAVISSDTYADITVALPASEGQRTAMEDVLATARQKLEAEPDNDILAAHIQEADQLMSQSDPSSSEVGSLIAELTELTAEKTEKAK